MNRTHLQREDEFLHQAPMKRWHKPQDFLQRCWSEPPWQTRPQFLEKHKREHTNTLTSPRTAAPNQNLSAHALQMIVQMILLVPDQVGFLNNVKWENEGGLLVGGSKGWLLRQSWGNYLNNMWSQVHCQKWMFIRVKNSSGQLRQKKVESHSNKQ